MNWLRSSNADVQEVRWRTRGITTKRNSLHGLAHVPGIARLWPWSGVVRLDSSTSQVLSATSCFKLFYHTPSHIHPGNRRKIRGKVGSAVCKTDNPVKTAKRGTVARSATRRNSSTPIWTFPQKLRDFPAAVQQSHVAFITTYPNCVISMLHPRTKMLKITCSGSHSPVTKFICCLLYVH